MHNLPPKEGFYLFMTERGRRLLKLDFVRFCIVGGVGFLVHSGMFFLLSRGFAWQPELAYLAGAETALFSNFAFHNLWTYAPREVKKPKRVLLTQFHVSFWSGALINFLVFVIIIRLLHLPDIIGLVVGSATALFWNFFWTKYYIWQAKPKTEQSELPE